MGSSKDYTNIPEWKTKDTGYHTGDMVKYKSNIFRAAYWAGKEPGVDPGWSLYDELYDETSQSASQAAKVIGYLPTWRNDLDYGNAVMYQNITHGIIAFLQFDEKNLGELDDKSAKAVSAIVQQVVTTAHKAGTYISVALGGATDYGFLNLLTAVGGNASDARLDKAVQNVVKFVKDNALDGVDLDLECWWDPNSDASKDQGGRAKSSGPHPAGSALVSFAQKLKAALPGKLVSATLFATSWYGNSYDPALADHVDWLSIMSYDLTGSWNQTPVGPHTALYKIRKQDQYAAEQQGPWPNTAKGPTNGSTPMEDNPIFSVEDSLWYWSNPFFVNWQGEGQKIARNKLVAGVPLYGYDFAYKKDPDPESGQTPPGYKVLRYKELVQQFPGASTAGNANIKISGSTPRPSFVSASGSYPYAHNLYFETPDTAVTKLNFLRQIGLQGVIIWELSNEVWDGPSIVKALYNASGNPATRPALPAPRFAAQPGGLTNKPPVQSGDLTGKAGQNWTPEQSPKYGTAGVPSLVVYNDVLFAVHEGWAATSVLQPGPSHAPTGQIWFTGFKNGQWNSPNDTNTNYGTSGPPAVIVYKDTLYAFHEGYQKDGQLWLATGKFDNGNISWKGDNKTGFGTTGAPALAIYKDKLYCVHLGAPPSDALWWACYDGQKWSQDTSLNVGAAGTPTLAVYNDKLYCAYQGTANGEFWYVVYDGKSWTSGNKTPYATYNAPTLAVFNGKLLAFHEGYQSGTRSFKLWYTARDDKDWNQPRDTDTGFGVTDPPALAVVNNKLYCVHDGRASNGEIWWFTVDGDTLSQDQKIDGHTAASKPALAEFQGDLYCVYQTPGMDGYMGWTKLPASSQSDQPGNADKQWLEAHGENSYSFYMLERQAAGDAAVSTNKTIKVDAGAPFLYAALIKSADTVDFPTGATLKITSPDNEIFDTANDDNHVYVLTESGSLRMLVIRNPVSGDYKVELTVPQNVGFFIQIATTPTQDVYDTISSALPKASGGSGGNETLAKRAAEKADPVTLAFVGIAAIAIQSDPQNNVVDPNRAVPGLMNAITSQAVWYLYSYATGTATVAQVSEVLLDRAQAMRALKATLGGNFNPFRTYLGNIEDDLRAAQAAGANVATKPKKQVRHLRVATWNIGTTFTLGGIHVPTTYPPFRMALFSLYGWTIGIDIIAFQEVPNNLSQIELAAIAGIGYQYQYLPMEYPQNTGRPNNRGGPQKAYLVLYRPDILRVTSNIDFLRAAAGLHRSYVDHFVDPENGNQCRAPAMLELQVIAPENQYFGKRIEFVTWHNEEAPRNLSAYLVYVLSLLVENDLPAVPDWIIAGDFNWANVDGISDVDAGGRIHSRDPATVNAIFEQFGALSGGTTRGPDGNKDHILASDDLVGQRDERWREISLPPTFESDSGHLALIMDIGE